MTRTAWVQGVAVAAALGCLALLQVPGRAQVCPANADGTPNCQMATKTDISTLTAKIPTPATTVPPGATAAGAAGTSNQYVPIDALAVSKIRAGVVTTASDGTWTFTMSPAMAGTAPTVLETPIATSTMPIVCNLTATPTSTTATGKCWQSQALTVSVLGATLSPFTTAAANVKVQIIARDGS
jgi:hypothetical protein